MYQIKNKKYYYIINITALYYQLLKSFKNKFINKNKIKKIECVHKIMILN